MFILIKLKNNYTSRFKTLRLFNLKIMLKTSYFLYEVFHYNIILNFIIFNPLNSIYNSVSNISIYKI